MNGRSSGFEPTPLVCQAEPTAVVLTIYWKPLNFAAIENSDVFALHATANKRDHATLLPAHMRDQQGRHLVVQVLRCHSMIAGAAASVARKPANSRSPAHCRLRSTR